MKRFRRDGYVYVAFSTESQLVKIGLANTIAEREKSLNKKKYAGQSDWEIIHSVYCPIDAGQVEASIQRELANYSSKGRYYFDGDTFRESREVFNCEPEIAIKALQKLSPIHENKGKESKRNKSILAMRKVELSAIGPQIKKHERAIDPNRNPTISERARNDSKRLTQRNFNGEIEYICEYCGQKTVQEDSHIGRCSYCGRHGFP